MLDLNRTRIPALLAVALVAACSAADYPTEPRFEIVPVLPVDVTFTYVIPEGAPAVTSINVAGTLNEWNTTATPMTDNGDGTWSVTVELEQGTYEYKYVFNGPDGWVSNMCNDPTWGDPNNGGKVDPDVDECLDGGNGVRNVSG